jgi:tRNA splicing endonuclease
MKVIPTAEMLLDIRTRTLQFSAHRLIQFLDSRNEALKVISEVREKVAKAKEKMAKGVKEVDPETRAELYEALYKQALDSHELTLSIVETALLKTKSSV